MDQGKTKKITIYFIIFTIFLVLILTLFFRPEWFNLGSFFGTENLAEENEGQEQKFAESTFFDDGANADEVVQKEEKSLLESENYKIQQITFGGSAITGAESFKELPASVVNLESEALLSTDNKEAKILISWETNKEVISTVEYSLSDGQNAKTAGERKYNSSHRLVLSDLDPGAVYIYRIKSRDRWGQEFVSEYYSVYSGSPAISVFDLISKSMNEIFGWAIKNNF